MESTAYFTDIRKHIAGELNKATLSIYVAVAWLTDDSLFRLLCNRAAEGLDVRLLVMDDDINQTYGADYLELERKGGKVFLIDTGDSDIIMHNKFCVIDHEVVITGSYNWSKKAASNHENITITKGFPGLAEAFEQEFSRLKQQYHGKDALKSFDAVLVQKRLQVILGLIELGDYGDIAAHVDKIKEFQLVVEVLRLVDTLEVQDYTLAASRISDYLLRTKSLVVFDDENLDILRMQIRYLEIEIISLENERASILKIVTDFVHQYTLALGDIALELLRKKKVRLGELGRSGRRAAFERAEREYEEYKQRVKTERAAERPALSEDEQEALKKAYRKAVFLCHPDKIADENKRQSAQRIFVALQEAYEKNDLEKILMILNQLEAGIYDLNEPRSISDRGKLERRLEELRARYDEMSRDLEILRKNKDYKLASSIPDWALFFQEERTRMEEELKNMNDE
jgi:hypothetical protein